MSVNSHKGRTVDSGECRCCGVMKKCRILNEEYDRHGQREVYSDMFVQCFGLVLPQLDKNECSNLICDTCVLRLRDACAFRLQVKEREEILQQTRRNLIDIGHNDVTKITERIKVEVTNEDSMEEVDSSDDEEHAPDTMEDELEKTEMAIEMPFKIVETLERGKPILTVVPDKWEKNGSLCRSKRKENLLSAKESHRDGSWLSRKCNFRRNIISKDVTEVEISLMSDSDVEESNKNIKPSGKSINKCFKDFPRPCLEKNKANSINPTGITQKIDSLLMIVGTLHDKQGVLFNALQKLENNVMHKLEYMNAQPETFSSSTAKTAKVSEMCFKIISSKEDLENFEAKLKTPSFRCEIKKRLSIICGVGKGRALNNAYALADKMFSRKFMTQCSWAGGSRKSFSKLCFKAYTGTIDLFYEIVYESDQSFTMLECEAFLKNIMRHAVTRDKAMIKRAPSSKRRQKKVLGNTSAVDLQFNPVDNQPVQDNGNDSTGLVDQPMNIEIPVHIPPPIIQNYTHF